VNTDHNSGSPETASPEILALMKERIAPFRQRRLDATARAAARLA
jgi:cyclohexyl-isocyanide hydratase